MSAEIVFAPYVETVESIIFSRQNILRSETKERVELQNQRYFIVFYLEFQQSFMSRYQREQLECVW